MTETKHKIDGTFSPVPGGYAQQIDSRTRLFVPDFCVSSFVPETGELYGFAPDYDTLEANKTHSVNADRAGMYSYCYETQHAPTGCDFSADLSYYGKHYFLRPLRDGLPQLRGRGVTYDAERNTYKVTSTAFEKLKGQYKIMQETCLN